VEIGVIHLEPGIASINIERDSLVVPDDAAVAEFEAIDGEREELLNPRLSRTRARAAGEISAAIGIESKMDDRLIQDKLPER
jgi:hypothetical protein